MSSEIRANLITSRAGLSTVTMTDSGPMFSGITTFVDNSGFTFGVGGGTSIFTPSTNVLTFGTNNTEKIRIDASGHMHSVGVITATHFYGDGSNLTGVSAGFSPDAQGNLVAGTSAGANFSGTDANHNILIGYEAGNALTTADNNVAIGFEALKSADTEGGNVAIGYRAMKEMTGFGGNVCIGYEAGYYTYGLWDCVAIGKDAMQKPTQSGYTAWSVAVGVEAMAACGASKCVAIGYEALHGNNASSAEDNTAIGYQSLTSVLSNGLKNTAVGSLSGKATTTGDENVYIGYNAGNNAHATGSNCIIIGNNSAASSTSVSNEITLGDTNITKFRVPGIDFILKDNGGTPTQGHVLTVDGSGEAGFAAPAGPTINNNANTRVITASGNANEFDAQASLTFSNSNNDPKLTISGTGHAQLNLTSTGGTDHTGINFGDSADINAGMIQYSNTGDSMQFHTAGAERARIDSNGHFLPGADSAYYLGSSSVRWAEVNTDKLSAGLPSTNGSVANFKGGNYNQINICHSGASGWGLLLTNSNSTSNGGYHESTSGNNTSCGIINVNNDALYLGTNNNARWRVEHDGHFIPASSGSYDMGSTGRRVRRLYSVNATNTSDRNLKNTITESDLGLDFICKLKPVSYKWNQKEGESLDTKTHYGLISQDVEEVIIETGKTLDDFGAIDKPDGDPMGLSYNEFVSPLVKAIQDLKSEINTLQQENQALRVRVTNLEDK